MSRLIFLVGGLILGYSAARADDADLKAILAHKINAPGLPLAEVSKYVADRLPKMPRVTTVAEWEKYAGRIRAEVLERTVYRGEGAAWRDAKTKVEWLATIDGGPGYRIKKLRYEAVPGLWIPALLYEPLALKGRVPVVLNVNGHDRIGKAAVYKQIRCINQAKRGMLALNVEWLGMGQLNTPSFAHGRMNQIDLCGTCGLAPFYLSMKRGLDVLLSHAHADPRRVAVTGLSGGGWQTIYISALDTRVTLTNPVAGYSGYLTRIHHHKDLGDSEQTPCDMATVADYTHLTALMAPRPTLLTYNSKDDCCFESGYVLPELCAAADPIFRLYGKPAFIRNHVNDDPGTHNYEKDNRQALYRMLGDHFYAGDKSFDPKEIACAKEVKNKTELHVELPKANADFHVLATSLAKALPHEPTLPGEKGAALAWQKSHRKGLHDLVNAKVYRVKAVNAGSADMGGIKATYWKLQMDGAWTVPLVELSQGAPKGTTIVVNDAGRQTEVANVRKLLAAGQRVLAVDYFYVGESKIATHDWLFALLVAAVGDRALGLQASQLSGIARWSLAAHRGGPVAIRATGPRTCTAALVAAALDTDAIAGLDLDGALGSLKEIIEQNRSVEQMPEMFCFGLLAELDITQLVALAAPRPVMFRNAGDRARKELRQMKAWYKTLGKTFDPLP